MTSNFHMNEKLILVFFQNLRLDAICEEKWRKKENPYAWISLSFFSLLIQKQFWCRNRLAKGLQIAHNHMGNLQLVSQYLTILGSLALALHDTVQAREILRSSLTLAKKLSDIPTQIWVLSVLTGIVVPLAFNFLLWLEIVLVSEFCNVDLWHFSVFMFCPSEGIP